MSTIPTWEDQTGQDPTVALNELRKSVAEMIGADPDTWPDHGNAPLAIAAHVALQGVQIQRLRAHVDDLQSGMWINCVYCGHRYGPGDTTPVSMADALKDHVERCPEHPMSRLRQQMGTIVEGLRSFADAIEEESGTRWIATAPPSAARRSAC